MMTTLHNTEFYTTPEGTVMVKPVGQAAYELKENCREIVCAILAIIRERYPKAHAALMELYSSSSMNRIYYEYRVVHRFIRCNFGEYNQGSIDINHNGTFQFEEVGCPLRGECPLEGVVCKPELDTQLTERETEVFRLYAQNLQTEQIADELHISPCTVNRHRENIKAKLRVNTVAEMVAYWYANCMK